MPAALPVILVFLALLTAVGAWHARRIKTADDFALAGRRLGAPVLIGTLAATWIGTGSLFGSSEFAYEQGAIAFILPVSGAAGIVALAFLAPRARAVPAGTVPQILGLRFGAAARVIGALALIGAYLIIVSYQFRAGAAVVQRVVPGSGAVPGIVGFAMFVILYTVMAGMLSVAWTDLFNGVLMAVGLMVALVLVLRQWELGQAPVVAQLARPHESPGAAAWVGLMLPSFLLVLGDANLYQRFMSARDAATARRAAVGMFFAVLALEWIIVSLALLGRILLPTEPAHHGHTIIEMAFTIVHPAVGTALAATAIAVVLTTADSYLLGSATSAAADLTGGRTTPARQRLIVVLLGLAALGLAFTSDRFLSVALYAYTLYGASLTPAILAALLRPRTPPAAIVSGMGSGLAVALLWKLLAACGALPGALDAWDPVLPALAANLLAVITVGLIIRAGR